MPRTLILALALVLLTPAAAAGWLSDPVEIAVPPLHVGDLFRYEERSASTLEDELRSPSTYLVLVEAPTTVLDRYGLARQADAYRVEQHVDGDLVHSERCYAAPAGGPAVRRDILFSGMGGKGWAQWSSALGPVDLGSGRYEMEDDVVSAFYDAPCRGASQHGGKTYREGDVLSMEDLMPGASEDFGGPAVLSAPARVGDFHGRTALVFDFDLTEPMRQYADVPADADIRISMTLAEGLPGVARTEGELRSGTVHETFASELVGYEAGAGPALVASGEPVPDRNPAARFVAWSPLAFDDAAWELPYPYAAAFAAVTGDPAVGLRAWLDRHPDAFLSMATYSRAGQDPFLQQVGSEGVWTLAFTDGRSHYLVTTERGGRAAPAVAALGDAGKPVVNQDLGEGVMDMELTAPRIQEVVDSATARRLAQAAGVRVDAVAALSYSSGGSGGGSWAYVGASDLAWGEDGEGRSVFLDAVAGGQSLVLDTRGRSRESGILAPPSFEDDAARGASAFAALAGPVPGAGLAGGAAATGLALLVLLAKFVLFPLFTRLRRDRLLENEVRARLFEQVRREPGVHRAQLVEYLGVGEGATRHHLRQLVGARLLVETRDGGFARYFCAGEVPPDVARREGVLRAGSARRVYELYAGEPSLPLREAAARLGMSAPSVHRAKRKLERAGLLPAAEAAAVVEA